MNGCFDEKEFMHTAAELLTSSLSDADKDNLLTEIIFPYVTSLKQTTDIEWAEYRKDVKSYGHQYLSFSDIAAALKDDGNWRYLKCVSGISTKMRY